MTADDPMPTSGNLVNRTIHALIRQWTVIPKQFDHIERLEKPVELRQIIGVILNLVSKSA